MRSSMPRKTPASLREQRIRSGFEGARLQPYRGSHDDVGALAPEAFPPRFDNTGARPRRSHAPPTGWPASQRFDAQFGRIVADIPDGGADLHNLHAFRVERAKEVHRRPLRI